MFSSRVLRYCSYVRRIKQLKKSDVDMSVQWGQMHMPAA